MNHAVVLRIPLLLLAASIFAGCATSPQAAAPAGHAGTLFQLSDRCWADLSDVREIVFTPAASNGDAQNTARIYLAHHGSADTSFTFEFADQAAAIDAWKRLVKYLGGSLNEADWKASPSSPAGKSAQAASLQPAVATSQNPSFTNLRKDLNELTLCHDQKLITAAEYDRAHQRTIASFITVAKRNEPYRAQCDQLSAELNDLEQGKKDRLLNDDEALELHKSILIRHDIAPE